MTKPPSKPIDGKPHPRPLPSKPIPPPSKPKGAQIMTSTDAAFAAARDTAEAAARREMERSLAWAEHVADALLVIEEADDE